MTNTVLISQKLLINSISSLTDAFERSLMRVKAVIQLIKKRFRSRKILQRFFDLKQKKLFVSPEKFSSESYILFILMNIRLNKTSVKM